MPGPQIGPAPGWKEALLRQLGLSKETRAQIDALPGEVWDLITPDITVPEVRKPSPYKPGERRIGPAPDRGVLGTLQDRLAPLTSSLPWAMLGGTSTEAGPSPWDYDPATNTYVNRQQALTGLPPDADFAMAPLSKAAKAAKLAKEQGQTMLDKLADQAAAAARAKAVRDASGFGEAVAQRQAARRLDVESVFPPIKKPGPKPALLSHLERAPVEQVEGRNIVSSRVPEGKEALRADPGDRALVTGMEEVRLDPDLEEKFADQVRKYHILTPREKRMNTRGVLDAAEEKLTASQDFLMKLQPGDLAEREKFWYQGGHRIGNEVAAATGFKPNQTTAVIATQSPSKEWNQNVELGIRIPHRYRLFEKDDTAFTKDLYDRFVDTTRISTQERIKSEKLTGDAAVGAWMLAQRKMEEAKAAINVRWSSLNDLNRARLMRAWDELNMPQEYDIWSPEGDRWKPAMTKERGKDRRSLLVWNSYDILENALSILRDDSPENISLRLGRGHKVRSFHNNLNNPFDPRFMTPDTHNVIGGLMMPGADEEVRHVMGGRASAGLGIQGLHPLYRDAGSAAARANNLLPSQGQSVAWESIKGLFSPRQRQDDDVKKGVQKLWNEYRQGRATLQDTYANIADFASRGRGTTLIPPPWSFR